MGQELYSAGVAIGLGFVVGVLLFVPFVAMSYRRRGRLTLWRTVLWSGALVYFLAIWTYTLLPLPAHESLQCAPANFDPMVLFDELRTAFASAGNPLKTPQFLQLALNIVLFIPLGFFLRVLGGRGILVATFAGLCISAVIEFTQLTGVWGIYPCAYRMFDVVDLLMNTAGATIGSVIAFVIPARWRQIGVSAEASLPRPVTKPRRFLGMISDGLAFFLTQTIIAVTVQAIGLYVFGFDVVDFGDTSGFIGLFSAIVIWVVVAMVSGRTVGDMTVQIRYVDGPFPVLFSRLFRVFGGIVGYVLVLQIPEWGGTLGFVFLLLSLILLISSKRGRGLPGLLSRQQVTDSRAELERLSDGERV